MSTEINYYKNETKGYSESWCGFEIKLNCL